MSQSTTVPNVKPSYAELSPVVEPRLMVLLMAFRQALLLAARAIEVYLRMN